MSKIKRVFSVIAGMLLVAGCVFGVFLCSGISLNGGASPQAGVSFDRPGGTVKKAVQDITGKINIKSDTISVTYKVYSDIDRGKLSFEGKAAVTGDRFSINSLKLKPQGNTIVVTAKTKGGKTEEQTLNINYDSSHIKDSALRNVARVDSGSNLFYVNNNLLVYFDENVSDAGRQEIIDTVGGTCVGYVNGINMWQVEVKPASYDALKKMAAGLTAMDGVFYAGCNFAHAAATMATVPSDPWYDNKNPPWNELNPYGGNWSVEAVQALSAWDYQRFFSHINVGIVDAGVQNDHEDLAGKIFFPDADSAAENDPAENHGTHVAGIMGAIPNNNKGVTGILWDTNMYCYNWETIDGTDAHLFAGLTDTVQAGAKVVNFSLGVANDISGYGAPGVNSYVISYARQSEAVMTPLLNAGYDFIVVESAGNGMAGYSQDAVYNGYFCSVTYSNLTGTTAMTAKINERIIIVGSAYRYGQLSFMQVATSNAGSQVDICAPGGSIYSCYAGNSYNYMSGTSMASPMVAAIAALTWSVNPALTGSQVRSILLSNTSYNVADNTSIYHPLVNTYRMVNAKLSVEAAIATHAPDYSAVNAAVAAANALNSTLYTPASWAVLASALSAVDYNLLYIQQDQIDAMATNINSAVSALVLKTVPYTVEYRLNSADGTKLASDKAGSGSVTAYVTETPLSIDGYSPLILSQNLQLGLDGNKMVFIYVVKPNAGFNINTYKQINGQMVPVSKARAGDIITVRITPTTDFFCGASRYIVMYDMNFYTLLGSGTAAFTVNPENAYYARTVVNYGGITTSPVSQWPSTFVNGESALYKFTSTAFNTVSSGYPTVMNDGKWLFSFNLQVRQDAAGSGRIFMDNRWMKTPSNLAGVQYFYWCASGDALNSTGNNLVECNLNYANADKQVTLDSSVYVNFDLNGGAGTDPATINGAPGTSAALPPQGDITRPGYTFSGWAATANAAAALGSYTFPQADSTLYAVWSRIPVTLSASGGSTTVINPGNNFIYGLRAGITKAEFESSYVTVDGDGRLAYTPAAGPIGTGTRVDVIDNVTGLTSASYTIVIFGDINGDGFADGSDASIAVLLTSGMLTQTNAGSTACLAADANHDGVVDALDADLLESAGLMFSEISQTP